MFQKKQTPATLFTEAQKEAIQDAIRMAELNTSGEIRVHVDVHCEKENPSEQAIVVFEELKMHETEQRNGVLFYLAVADKKFAILGDKGINEAVPAGFWDEIRDGMKSQFQHGAFDIGLIEGIQKAGEKLKLFFPLLENDEDELSNEISFGNPE